MRGKILSVSVADGVHYCFNGRTNFENEYKTAKIAFSAN